MLTIETAIDVFVESFSFVHNLTLPVKSSTLVRSESSKPYLATVVTRPVTRYGYDHSWGRSTKRHQSIAYVAGMSTNKAYRRRGLASAILSRMLVDDAAQGASYSVLLASREGYALYRKCGYEQIGSLHMFVPR